MPATAQKQGAQAPTLEAGRPPAETPTRATPPHALRDAKRASTPPTPFRRKLRLKHSATSLPHPSSVLRSPSSVLPHPSSLLRSPSSVLRSPSSLLRSSSSVLRHSKNGLTLIEVVLAIAVAGFVLAAATAFVVSIANIWSERDARNFFEDHVDGVTEFLRAGFASAGTEIALETAQTRDESDSNEENNPNAQNNRENGADDSLRVELNREGALNTPRNRNRSSNAATATGGLVRRSDEPVGWARPPGHSDFEPPLLNLRLAEAPPLLVDAESVSSLGIDAYLHFEREQGLSLLWSSILQEEVEDERDLRRTPISPLVKKMTYVYWDERFEQWDELDEPKEGDGDDQFPLPRYLKLVFEYQGVTKERVLTIPVPSQSALIY